METYLKIDYVYVTNMILVKVFFLVSWSLTNEEDSHIFLFSSSFVPGIVSPGGRGERNTDEGKRRRSLSLLFHLPFESVQVCAPLCVCLPTKRRERMRGGRVLSVSQLVVFIRPATTLRFNFSVCELLACVSHHHHSNSHQRSNHLLNSSRNTPLFFSSLLWFSLSSLITLSLFRQSRLDTRRDWLNK